MSVTLFTASFVLCFLFSEHVEHRDKAMPSLQLSNWADSLLCWRQNRQALTKGPTNAVGPFIYNIAPSYDHSAIKGDSFAFLIGGACYGADPKLFEASPSFGHKGVLETEVYSYNEETMPLTLKVDYQMPPYCPFYTVTYKLSNPSETDAVEGSFLSYVELNPLDDKTNPVTDMTSTAQDIHSSTKFTTNNDALFCAGVLGKMADYAEFTEPTYSVGDKAVDDKNVLKQFIANNGKLKNEGHCTANVQQVGISWKFNIPPNSEAKITVYRCYRTTNAQMVKALELAQSSTTDSVYQRTKKQYSSWLSRAKMPATLNQKEMDLYINSLLLLKNGQNPTVGTIMASMHENYDYKTWTRDGFFAALVLSEAGFVEEGSKYFRWMAKCDLVKKDGMKGKGYFSTCYNGFTGEIFGFVDPQLDNMGMFLMGAYHMSLDSRTRDYVNEMKTRITDIEDFLLENKGYKNLFLPDYSIWEESSDPISGDGVNVGYYAFTQAFAYAGLMSASKLEQHFLHNPARAEKLRRRAMELNQAIHNNLIYKDENGNELIYRQLYITNVGSGPGKADEKVKPETKIDSSTLALVWLGCLGFPSSSSSVVQIPSIRHPVAQGQYNAVIEKLSQALVDPDTQEPRERKDYMGIGRFENDAYFTEKGKWSPNQGEAKYGRVNPWGLTTMFTAWAELAMGKRQNVGMRLRWMAKVAADGALPVGECVRDDNQFVWTSAPDLYEHGGVFVWTALINERKAHLPNPMTWNLDNVA
ncbi:putative Carbohydrate-binding family 6 protein [Monocercomonoides exilis]|uniref:putative Carbohydrate-binding family 6 protein n=1 Tax=Monocercomonoides exilis TaxID=2049356 RepID=UPI00355983D6|nr:putative Carbohydrate-binding family 6 protein [Monocercomonoides exilis]|eukprot:MONOS_4385.1-p1 / transcript=MONOS_4385.1 / gene=MONOS_4385 / organism=Monocercomonoides_exilis_PA203 / gene_product=Carbohydrate-binding family 6 protein / transcript_product=Carbohydrate-binding family 6 protein / location=Mono_scaffold00116:51847-55086(-) / protein_length=754 / sequence_SO=supercontig / SO=protein_coding / is_pseudo=false